MYAVTFGLGRARWLLARGLLALGVLVLVSCEDSAADASAPSLPEAARARPIELFTWWTRVGESDALGELVYTHRKSYPDDDVINASAELSGLARKTLAERMQRGDPPDLFEANAGHDLLQWVLVNHIDDRESKLLALDSLVEDAAELKAALPPALLEQVTYRGKLYGVPANLHRINEVFYNKALFQKHGLIEPKTMSDLFALGKKVEGTGIPLIAIGTKEPWTLALLGLECILIAQHGPAFYTDYFRGNLKPDDPRIIQTLETMLSVLRYANADHAQLSWLQALQLVARGGAFMTVMGDWARAALRVHGLTFGKEYGELPFPGTAQTFVFTSDAFGLPRAAKNPQGAARLLATIGSAAGQLAIGESREALAARKDVTLSHADAVLEDRKRVLEMGTLVLAQSGIVPARFATDINAALAEAVAQGNPEPALHALRSRYALLR